MLKRLVFLAVTAIVLLGTCGCTIESTAEKTKNRALEYLESNYDDVFTPLGYSSSSWAYDYSTVTFSSEKYADEAITVQIYEKDGKFYFEDDYYKLYMKDDATEFFSGIVAKYDITAEIKVGFISPMRPEGLTAESTFSDYVDSETCNMRVYIITNEGISADMRELILRDISDNSITGYFKFVVTSDPELFKQYSINEVVNQHLDQIAEKYDYSIDKDFQIISSN